MPNISIGIYETLSRDYQENAEIAGIKAYRKSVPSVMQSEVESIEFKKGNYIYRIFLLYDDGNIRVDKYDPGTYNKEAVETFNYLLGTFSFTN